MPELAESYQLAPDGTSITLNLRKGVKFQPGHEVTTDDVLFTIDWFKDAKNAAPIRAMTNRVAKAETPTPARSFCASTTPIPALRHAGPAVHPRQEWGRAASAATRRDGPVPPLAEFRPNDLIKWSRTQTTGAGQAESCRVRPAAVRRHPAMALALEAGQADVIWLPAFPDLVRLGKDPAYATSPGRRCTLSLILLSTHVEAGSLQQAGPPGDSYALDGSASPRPRSRGSLSRPACPSRRRRGSISRTWKASTRGTLTRRSSSWRKPGSRQASRLSC